MNYVNRYYKLKKENMKNQFSLFIHSALKISNSFLILQFGFIFTYCTWYYFFGVEHFAHYGYTFEELIWAKDTGDSVLSPLFFINLLFTIVLSFVNFLYLNKKWEAVNINMREEEVTLITVAIGFLSFLFFSWGNIHIGNLFLFTGGLFGISLALFIASYFQKTISNKNIRKINQEIDNTFEHILTDNESLNFLKENSDNYDSLYKKITNEIFNRNRELIFSNYCENKNKNIESEKMLEQEIGRIENI